MTKILTAILVVVTVTALVTVSIVGFLVGGVTGIGVGDQTVTVSVPAVSGPGVTTVAIPAPITSDPLPPMGGTNYNRMIYFDAGITVDGATTTLATTTVTNLYVTEAAIFDSDLTIAGSLFPAHIATTTTTTLATTTATKLTAQHLYVSDTMTNRGTSTLSLDLIVDTDLLYVNTYNDKVGIGTTSPNALFAIYGTTTTGGELFRVGTTTTDYFIIDGSGGLTVAATTTLSATLVAAKADLGKTVQGGAVEALSGDASSTLTSTQVCENSTLTQVASTSKNTGGHLLTLTLPATSTLYADCLETNGDMMSILFVNSTSSYGASTTLSGNLGIGLLEPSGGDVIILPAESARLDFTRISAATTTVEVTSLQKAD